MEPNQSFFDTLNVARRRAALLGGLTAAGALIAVIAALVLPPKYETTARILIESQQIPSELARSTISTSAFERLQLIEQQLMSRERLVNLVQKFGLYADRPGMTLMDKARSLRAATTITSNSLGVLQQRGDATVMTFSLTVSMTDPVQAAAVANELVSAVLQQNLRSRSERARETLGFFESESRRISAELAAVDDQIRAFKDEHETALPESLEFRRSELARLENNSLEIDRRLLELEEQRGTLRADLAERDERPSEGLSIQEQELGRLETELAQKRSVLSARHPAIRDLEARITSLRAIGSSGATSPESGGAAADGDSERDRVIENQIQLVETQMSALREQQAALTTRREAIRASIEQTPAAESELNALERRHAELSEQYATILQKRAEAHTGERLEASQQAERFEVLENALVPDDPISPKRKKIVVLGSGVSAAMAVCLVLLLEMLNPAIRTSAQMQRQLNLTPVVAIPYIGTGHERRRRRAFLAGMTLLLAAGLTTGLWVVDKRVRPIETVFTALAESTGATDVVRLMRARL